MKYRKKPVVGELRREIRFEPGYDRVEETNGKYGYCKDQSDAFSVTSTPENVEPLYCDGCGMFEECCTCTPEEEPTCS